MRRERAVRQVKAVEIVGQRERELKQKVPLEASPSKATRSRLREVLLNADVAKALVGGTPSAEIAAAIGVSEHAVNNIRRDPDMVSMIEAEQLRILQHLGTRDLGKEGYRDLTVGFGVLFDKRQLAQGLPTEIVGKAEVDSIYDSIFGPGRAGEGTDPVDGATFVGSGRSESYDREDDAGGEAEPENSDDGGEPR